MQNPPNLSATYLVRHKRAFIHSGTLELRVKPPYHDNSGNDPRANHIYDYLCAPAKYVGVTNPRTWIDSVYLRLKYILADTPEPNSENVTLTRIRKAHVWSERHSCFYDVDGFAECLTPSTRTSINDPDGNPPFSELKKHNINFLYLSKPKLDMFGTVEFNVPLAILEMAACAQYLEKDIIRGVVTNGPQWIFLILQLNTERGFGGVYPQSAELDLLDPVSGKPSREATCLLTNIMTHWVRHIHEGIGAEDLFTLRGVGFT